MRVRLGDAETDEMMGARLTWFLLLLLLLLLPQRKDARTLTR